MCDETFQKVEYATLNGKQQEVHNFHQIAARLAECGYATYPIRDDWNGGDMIARHMTDAARKTLTIQIKSRMTFGRKYQDKDIWIAFLQGDDVFVFPHDSVLKQFLKVQAQKGTPLENNGDWRDKGLVHWGRPTKDLQKILEPYRLPS